MATIGAQFLTLADIYKRQLGDSGKQVAAIIEILSRLSPVVRDAIAVECNLATKHMTTIRTGLPEATWRRLYQGVQPGKSTTAQVEDTTGMLEALSHIDSKLVELNPNPGALRLSEAVAFIEGMTQQMETAIFYENTATKPEALLGLAPRFSVFSATDPYGKQITKGGGSGSDNTSIWFVTWGENTCHLLYPQGSSAGLKREDKGKGIKQNSDGSEYDVHREKFTWDCGVSVRDPRYIARLCNIDVSDLTIDAATGANLIPLMIDAFHTLQNPYNSQVAPGQETAGAMNTVIYCNRTIAKFLHHQARSAVVNSTLSIEKIEGKRIAMFEGLPIHVSDAILSTEATVP